MVKSSSKFSVSLSTIFNLGKMRYCPGTFGSIVGIVFTLPFFAIPHNLFIYVNIFFVIIIFLSVIPIHLSLPNFNEKDPHEIILDEFAGVICALLFVNPTIKRIVILVILFRILDIVKPWPISWAEKAPGAIGIILDDVIAGIASNLLLRAMEDMF